MTSGKNILFERGVYQDEKGRDFFFDNAKFLLILLVVMGHFMSPLKTGNDTLTLLWRLVNTLHMPCLIFISGYFAKRYITKDGIKVQRPFTYALLYVVAQLAVRLFEHFVLKKAVPASMFFAASSLWFLQCLFWWYLLLPLLDRFRKEYVMAFVVLLGIFSGYDNRIGDLLAFQRMLNHLPFFMAGYYTTKESVQTLFTKKARLMSIPALLIPIGFYWLLSLRLTPGLVAVHKDFSKVITSNYCFWNMPNISKIIAPQSWWLLRVWFYVLAASLCYAFLVWVPRCKTFFTVWGSRTLQVYILHRFIYLAELEYGWWEPFNTTGGHWAMAGIAIAATIIMSLKPFAVPFDYLQGIKVTKLLKPADNDIPAISAEASENNSK